jgi:CHASE1-domain containing sensor protein/tRNA A-37 threonylcarbamoyl transferase component Bud32
VLGFVSCWVLAGLAFWAVERWHSQKERAELNERAALVAAHLEASFAGPLETLLSMKQLLESNDAGTSPETFLNFCGPALARNPRLLAIEWLPLVPESERAAFEQWMGRQGAAYEIREPLGRVARVKARERPLHLPIGFSCPQNDSALGLDFGKFLDRGLARAFHALDNAGIAATTEEHLLEDPTRRVLLVFVGLKEARFVAGEPESREPGAIQDSPTRFGRGFVVGLFRLPDLFLVPITQASLEGVELSIVDSNAAEGRGLLYGSAAPEGRAVEQGLHFADQTYRLSVWERHPEPHGVPWLWFVLIGGLGSTLVLLIHSRLHRQSLEHRLARLGQYQLERKIAESGMASVYKARHALLKRPTAIKIARPELPSQHFEREVKLQSSLTHPNTATVYDFGRGDNGQFYCAMEYIEGYDLETLVERFGTLPSGRALRILHQAAASLAEAHDKSFIHQDVKPSNIMITERGGVRDFVKVLDFGLARVRNIGADLNRSLSASGVTVFSGTPGFAAPEVVVGAQGSPASDIFSLGAVGYFLLTGKGPLDAPHAGTFLSLSLAERCALLDGFTSKPIAELVARCLARKPEERPLSMQGLSEQLRKLLATAPPWTAEDADLWWKKHPPQADTVSEPSSFSL